MNNCAFGNLFLLLLISFCSIAAIFFLSQHEKGEALALLIPSTVCLIAILYPCKKKECKHPKYSIGYGNIIPGTRIYRFPVQCFKCKQYFFMEIDNEKQTTKFYPIDKEVLDL